MDYVDNGPCLSDILADVLKEKTGMRVDVQLREPASEHSYEWQVVRLQNLDGDWINFRAGTMDECIMWMQAHCSETYDYTLKRVRVESRGKLSHDATRFLDRLYGMYKPGKIDAIITVRSAWGVGLREAKELVEDYLNNL